ncbi:MAG: hypothetical protein Q7T01_03760 [bacterium]|nr:hypothetical protein [bacterium]
MPEDIEQRLIALKQFADAALANIQRLSHEQQGILRDALERVRTEEIEEVRRKLSDAA